MDSLKTKTANSYHVVFNFISILCTSTAMYHVLIDKMCQYQSECACLNQTVNIAVFFTKVV